MKVPISGITITMDRTALLVESQQPMQVISSAVIYGGLRKTCAIINRHVDKDYDLENPKSDFFRIAKKRGYPTPFVGLMTAAYVDKASQSHDTLNELTVASIVTVGLSNAAAAGLSEPVKLRPGTINAIVIVDGLLSPAAMVNAVMTVTEAKTAMLHEKDIKTEAGFPATGTTTDSVVVACTGRGNLLPYAGTATPVGYLIGRTMRSTLKNLLT